MLGHKKVYLQIVKKEHNNKVASHLVQQIRRNRSGQTNTWTYIQPEEQNKPLPNNQKFKRH